MGSLFSNPIDYISNALQGNPKGAAAAADSISKLQQQAYAQGNSIKNFLMGQKGQSEAYFKPMQQMFGRMYGTGGLMPAQAPGVPGSALPGRMPGAGVP